MSELYDRIEMLCRENHVSITTMCKKSGVSRAPLTDLKMGRSKTLSSASLAKIAAYFHVSLDYLLGNVSEPYFYLDNNRILNEINSYEETEEKPATDNDSELYELLEDIRRNPDLRAMFSLAKDATPEQVRQYINVIKAIRGEDTDG